MKKVSKVKTVETLEHSDCRWPIGDPRHADFHFCGAQQVLGKPYCKQHAELACEAAKPRAAASYPLPMIRRAA